MLVDSEVRAKSLILLSFAKEQQTYYYYSSRKRGAVVGIGSWLQVLGSSSIATPVFLKPNAESMKPLLFTKSGFHGNSLAALGPAPGDDRASALGLHTGAKTVRLRAVTTVRLECAFRHEKSCAPDVSNWIRSCDW